MSTPRRAYAKLLGIDGLVYYITDFRITFGRGPGVDLVVSDDPSISRVHGRIEYSSEAQAFELHILSKNGTAVNGRLLYRGSAPVTLHSQTEISFGNTHPVSLVFLLPSTENIPHPPPKQHPNTRPRALVSVLAQVLLSSPHGRLNAGNIVDELLRKHRDYATTFGSRQILESSVRFALTMNRQIFCVHPALDLEASVHDPDVMMLEGRESKATIPDSFRQAQKKVSAAQFSISPDHVLRFLGEEKTLEWRPGGTPSQNCNS